MALPSCLQYKNVNTETYSKSFCKDVTGTLAFNWMLNGQLGQNVNLVDNGVNFGEEFNIVQEELKKFSRSTGRLTC